MPSSTGTAPPERLVPLPRAMNGTPRRVTEPDRRRPLPAATRRARRPAAARETSSGRRIRTGPARPGCVSRRSAGTIRARCAEQGVWLHSGANHYKLSAPAAHARAMRQAERDGLDADLIPRQRRPVDRLRGAPDRRAAGRPRVPPSPRARRGAVSGSRRRWPSPIGIFGMPARSPSRRPATAPRTACCRSAGSCSTSSSCISSPPMRACSRCCATASPRVTRDRRLQLLLVAFCFGAFFEGASGFGTPVAITGAMLIGLGFTPLAASGLSLIANTAPVAFGALGTPIIALQGVTQSRSLRAERDGRPAAAVLLGDRPVLADLGVCRRAAACWRVAGDARRGRLVRRAAVPRLELPRPVAGRHRRRGRARSARSSSSCVSGSRGTVAARRARRSAERCDAERRVTAVARGHARVDAVADPERARLPVGHPAGAGAGWTASRSSAFRCPGSTT